MGKRKRKYRAKAAFALPVALSAIMLCFLFPQSVFAQNERKIIFVGDSRTVHMYETIGGVSTSGEVSQLSSGDEDSRAGIGEKCWEAKIGTGYDWMVSTAVPRIEDYLDENTDVVFLMGVNDCKVEGQAEKYASYIGEKAQEWEEKGVNTAYVSVNPVGSPQSPYYQGTYMLDNQEVREFNRRMQDLLPDDVLYIDTYDTVSGDYETIDGLHYDAGTYWKIYRKICLDLEEKTEEYSFPEGGAVSYLIQYALDGGTLSGERTSYTVETGSFQLGTPKKAGYRFGGWSMDEDTLECLGMPGIGGAARQVYYTPQKVEVPSGVHGDLEFDALWEKK